MLVSSHRSGCHAIKQSKQVSVARYRVLYLVLLLLSEMFEPTTVSYDTKTETMRKRDPMYGYSPSFCYGRLSS